MTPYEKAGFNEKSLFITQNWSQDRDGNNGQIVHLDRDDGSANPFFKNANGEQTCQLIDFNIKELPRDEDGYCIWEGGAQPVPDDWVVEVKTKRRPNGAFEAESAAYWTWDGVINPITAFRVVSTGEGKAVPDADCAGPFNWNEALPDTPYTGDGLVFETPRALDVQEGGDHYKKMKIQPMEYSMANGLDACQHTIIKYVSRFRDKGGIEDLRKAKHCIDMLIDFETDLS